MKPVSEIPFVARNAALDFVNTAEKRGDPSAGDALLEPGDLRTWGQRYGLLTSSLRLPRDAQAELDRAIEARELLYALFLARVEERRPRRDDLARLAELARAAYRAGTLRVDQDGSVHWHWSPCELTTVRHVAVASAVELIHTEPSPRLKQCPGDHCGWLFLDQTKRGNRRWCLMSECGQEAKDERRRRRRHADARGAHADRP